MNQPSTGNRRSQGFRSFLFNVWFYLWSIVFLIGILPVILLPRRGMFVVAHVWSWGILGFLRLVNGLTWKTLGRENIVNGPVIYALKHQSTFEIFAVSTLIRYPHWVVKRELTFIPVLGWYMWRAHLINVDRGAGSSAIRSLLRNARRVIEAGDPVLIFPEGHRIAPGTTGEYQPGVAALYSQLKVPVIPVSVNTGHYWARRGFTKRAGVAEIAFMEAIPPGLPRREFMEILHQRIEDRTRELGEHARAALGEAPAGSEGLQEETA